MITSTRLNLTKILESIPLPIFLIYSATIDKSLSQNWLGPYLASSIAALLATAILISKKIQLNRLFIGINLYLLSGSIGLLANLVWLNQLYGHLEAAGMLAWVIFVGLSSIGISPSGFIGVYSKDRKKIVISSLYLLLATLTALLVSLHFQGHWLYSNALPFVSLFAMHSMLKLKFFTEELKNA